MAGTSGRRRRPKLKTKEELISYLEDNQDTELPFNEEVWEKAVETTTNKERKFREIETTDFDGTKKVKKIPNGVLNPVSKYFQLMALPQYSKPTEPEFEGDDNDELDVEADFLVSFDDEEKEETVSSWINVFFMGYPNGDMKFLKERLSDYYDNYELNEGADKMLAIKAVADELEIMNLTKMRAKGKDVEARLEKVQKGYLSILDSLKALKKQRGANEEGKNKLTQWIDDLERAGEFKPRKDESYIPDDIDRMLLSWEHSMFKVLNEG